MTGYPLYPRRVIHDLNGIWDFSFLGDRDDAALDPDRIQCRDRIAVPGVFDACPAWAGKRGLAIFKTVVQITPGCRSMLKFGGLGLRAVIYVDGIRLKEWLMPYSGFSLDVPPSRNENRRLAVVIDNRFDFRRMPLFEQAFDFYGYGGIYRSVAWHELPAGTAFERVQIATRTLKGGIITARLLFHGAAPDGGLVDELRFEVDEQPVRPVTLDRHAGYIQAEIKVPRPVPWTPAAPCLHILKASLPGDEIVERFGLRTVAARKGRICLNGKPVKLLGFCRHEAHPQFGPSLPLAQLVQDLHHLKSMNCNFVRGSHYPQDQRFLDLCDESGLMVFEESLGWGQREPRHTGERFGRLQEQQTRLMVRNSVNHPAIVVWGILNEGGSNLPAMRHVYRRLLKAIREEDPSRLVTYASNVPDQDINFDLCDVISLNIYPGWYTLDIEKVRPLDEIKARFDTLLASLDRRGFADKPVLVSEIGAAALYGWHDACAFPWSEEFQAEYLDEVCRIITSSRRISGGSLWQFCDCRTYASNRALSRPRAFNNKGVLDEYRRPKMAAKIVAGRFRMV